jgi:hypothetical protein
VTFAAVGTGFGAHVTGGTSQFSLTPAAIGDLILAEIANVSNGTVSATALSSSNVTWTALGTPVLGTSHAWTAQVFMGTVTAASAATVSVSWSGTTPNTMEVAGQEFSSSAGAWAMDGAQGTLNSAGTNAWPSLTPSAAGGLYWGYAVNNGTAVAGTTSGYTYKANADTDGDGMAYNASCASGVATNPVWGDSAQAVGVMVLMKETGAAFLAPPNLPRGQAINRASTY